MTIRLYDTTLRDGTQREGLSLSVEDKLKIARVLDRLGVSYIEGGWPGSNPKDADFFRRIREAPLVHARIAAFGSTRRAGIACDADANLRALLAAETPVVTIVGKSSTLHVDRVLETTRDENLRMIGESVAFLKAAGREVIYDAEHFFDGYDLDPEYALATLDAAAAAGADCLVLCDTNGGALPDAVRERICLVRDRLRTPVGIHPHNDSGLAVANALAAVQAGAVQVQGTINGYGERCGNLDLIPLVATLQLKAGIPVLDPDALSRLTEVSQLRGRSGEPASGSPRAVRRTERVRAQGRDPRRRHREGAARAISTSILRRSATRCAWWSAKSPAGATSACVPKHSASPRERTRQRCCSASRSWSTGGSSSRRPRDRSRCSSAALLPATKRLSRSRTSR